MDCPLCNSDGGELIYRHPLFRVIDAREALYPGFLRLVWNTHVQEFSQLPTEQRTLCMNAVVLLEEFVLQQFKPDKVNLATLGNVVPHLHWHVIPRFTDDAHFPAPVWAAAKAAAQLSPRQQTILDTQSTWFGLLNECLQAQFG
ncbi:MAG TPA: HIT family protein [Limnobacter sp.]|uniref:HIT family protein n=1 Tax=Limnobacter sp. TaxID=2003368 RepID=UPI002ED7C0AF